MDINKQKGNKRDWAFAHEEASTSHNIEIEPDNTTGGVGVVLSKIFSEHNLTWNKFLSDIWQTSPYLFSKSNLDDTVLLSSSSLSKCNYDPPDAGRWRNDNMTTDPRNEIVVQGWHILLQLLEASQASLSTLAASISRPTASHQTPLIFMDQQVLSPDEVLEVHGNSLFGAYLNGASMVFNHADLINPFLAFLCQDLQQQQDQQQQTTESPPPGFPHVYANCYLTPPSSQTAPPHADDRDVLIFQVVGRKKWQVYSEVPVPYPYTHEQVGKDGLEVPSSVLHGPKVIDAVLSPGDVLYLPRGMVHQAQSTEDSLSFHITIAIATHDWTVAGNMSRQIESKLTQMVPFRKSALPFEPTINRAETVAAIQKDMESAFEKLRKEVTAESVLQDIQSRIKHHNQQAISNRMALIHRARVAGGMDHDTKGLGPTTEKHALGYTSFIRASTPSERAMLQDLAARTRAAKDPGLNVREEIADTILQIVAKVKGSMGTGETFQVAKLRELAKDASPKVCDLTLLCLAKRAVELGAFSVVE